MSCDFKYYFQNFSLHQKSHIFFPHTYVKLPLKVMRNEYCAFPQKKVFSDKNRDYRIMPSIFKRRKNLGSFLGFLSKIHLYATVLTASTRKCAFLYSST